MKQMFKTDKILNLKKSPLASTLSRRKKELNVYLNCIFKSGNPNNKFIIFSQGRTGSTLLCDLVNSHPQVYCDKEILYHHVFSPKSYINGKLKSSSKSVYGFKVKIYQLTQAQKIKDPRYFIQDLYENNWKIIYLKRNNLFRHALSSLVAVNRNQFHKKTHQEFEKQSKVYIDCDFLLKVIGNREKFLQQEAQILMNIPHISVTYEDELLKQELHQKTLNNIFDFLNLETHPIGTSFLKTVPENLELVIENYEEVVSRISQSQYGNFFYT